MHQSHRLGRIRRLSPDVAADSAALPHLPAASHPGGSDFLRRPAPDTGGGAAFPSRYLLRIFRTLVEIASYVLVAAPLTYSQTRPAPTGGSRNRCRQKTVGIRT
jgi:hypothetical protein